MASIEFIDTSMVPYVSTFLLIFAVVFGLLSYSKVGNFDKKVNAIISIAIALFALMYEPLVTSLVQYMPIVAGLLIVVFLLALLKKVFGGKKDDKKNVDTLPIVVALGILLLVLGIFSDEVAGYIPFGFDASNVLWIAGIIIVILFFWFVYSHKST